MTAVSLHGRVAIVTGSGAGLGRAYVLDLVRHGAAVVVNDVSPERADAVAAEIDAVGGRVVVSYDSVANSAGAHAIVRAALDAFGRLDGLVCNAGTMRNGYFEDLTGEDLDAMLAVHIGGCFHVTQAAWPVMRVAGYGRVVLVSSAGGMFALPGFANYAAAKGGVYGLGRALALEGRPHGILVNNLLPGGFSTITAESPVPDYERNVRAELRASVGPRRHPESVAPLVTFLLSDACVMSGETLSAVAGRYARVFVGVTEGWLADDPLGVTADDIAARLGEICEPGEYRVPTSLVDEYESIAARLGAV
jgi:NAD(P)-dependent dehydrogenase (short-subunit alcohol dehydrogenase family)